MIQCNFDKPDQFRAPADVIQRPNNEPIDILPHVASAILSRVSVNREDVCDATDHELLRALSGTTIKQQSFAKPPSMVLVQGTSVVDSFTTETPSPNEVCPHALLRIKTVFES